MISRNSRLIPLLICLASLAFSQAPDIRQAGGKPPAASQRKKPAKPAILGTGASTVDDKFFSGMRWRQVGPFRGGRVVAVTGVPNEPSVFYFGGASGGVWKTSDAGATWAPLFDKQAIASIGAIAVASSNHNIIYAGSGEACIRGNISYGNGIYKSVDGGKSWKNVGLRD